MKRLTLLLLAILFCTTSAFAAKEPKLDYGTFTLLPVLHEGRVKPLDSFARLKLLELSGQKSFKRKPAIEWLAEVLFDPAEAAQRRVIAVPDGWRTQLNLPKRKLHSLDEVATALQGYSEVGEELAAADPDKLTNNQRELLGLYKKVVSYQNLLRSFSLVLPLSLDVPEKYRGKEKLKDSYVDFLPDQAAMQKEIAALVKKKGTTIQKYTDKEKELTSFVFALEEVRAAGATNSTFKVIRAGDNWLSPWELLVGQNISIETWDAMAESYRAHNAALWLQNTQAARDPGVSKFRMQLERLYNITSPFHSAMGFYILGMIILGAEIIRKSHRLTFPFVCLGLGLASHVAGIMARVYILERPPVGTLYESLLFVSLICAVSTLVLFLRQKKYGQNYSMYFAGMSASAGLLFLAPFLLQQGEDMEMLVAVLNTNFWLATHVLCITAGYGVAILTALLAHAWLFLRWKGAAMNVLMPLQHRIYKISLVALLLTAVGTILGGIWADQSWGRFWGWDPKENGALLIVLWIIWMQHGRVSMQMKSVDFIATAAYLNVIVALAWFGVNLLSVGLHTYGFINGIAWALGLFVAIETIIIGTLWNLNRDPKNKIASA